MEDKRIIDLYIQRNERAIEETEAKYGAYCMTISKNILIDDEDSKENVNDAYMQAWNTIPPTIPEYLSSFLAKITRNLALNRYKAKHTMKRGGELELSLDELSECTPSKSFVDEELFAKELGVCISEFLFTEKELYRRVFVRRYFYGDSTIEVARLYNCSESKVKSMLLRTRNRLRLHLKREGYYEE